MDIVAHSLWAALACRWRGHRQQVTRAENAWTIALAAAPDLVQLAPIVAAAALTRDGWRAMSAYFQALPHFEPVLPVLVETVMHHLHCTMHSAIVACVVTMLIWKWIGRFWWPLVGWWSHIVIDVFTHSADFYPSPVLYPLTQNGFDGLAWNTPWFLWLNYAAIALVWTWQTRSFHSK